MKYLSAIKSQCESAKKRAGNIDKHCSCTDLCCPGCPFEEKKAPEKISKECPVCGTTVFRKRMKFICPVCNPKDISQ